MAVSSRQCPALWKGVMSDQQSCTNSPQCRQIGKTVLSKSFSACWGWMRWISTKQGFDGMAALSRVLLQDNAFSFSEVAFSWHRENENCHPRPLCLRLLLVSLQYRLKSPLTWCAGPGPSSKEAGKPSHRLARSVSAASGSFSVLSSPLCARRDAAFDQAEEEPVGAESRHAAQPREPPHPVRKFQRENDVI